MAQKQILSKPEEIKQVIPLADGRQLPLSRPLVMGILNVTPDSFYDGGRYDTPDRAADHALQMVDQGADIVDVGGESTRPAGVYGSGSAPVSATEEIRRVVPVIEAIRAASHVCISVDTYRASVAQTAIDAGADMVNDVSALSFDDAMAPLIARTRVPVVLMHMKGKPKDMQANPGYVDCVAEICDFFLGRLDFCQANAVDRSKLILDPGVGFGKRLSDNLEIFARLSRFKEFGLPLLVGASRKSFMGMLSGVMGDPEKRLGGSIAAAVVAVCAGANIVRVHDVEQTVQALKVVQGIRSIE